MNGVAKWHNPKPEVKKLGKKFSAIDILYITLKTLKKYFDSYYQT